MHEFFVWRSNGRAGNDVKKLRSGEEEFLKRRASPTGRCVIAPQRNGAMKTIVHCSTWASEEMDCVQLKWQQVRAVLAPHC
jgi:hypothetical protein